MALDRREAVSVLLDGVEDEVLLITGLGSSSYDAHACGDRPGTFYLWGAMGAAAMVGLGLAQARPDRAVVVITGDGEQIMGLGALATIGVAAPPNLTIVVIDNGRYGETGMQTSHTGRGLSLDGVAAACGFAVAEQIPEMERVRQVRRAMLSNGGGPRFYAIKVRPQEHPRSLPPRDAAFLKNRFRSHLGLAPT